MDIPLIGDTARVLVVDDTVINRQLLCMLLKKMGIHDIYQASNGDEALEMASRTAFDLALMDVAMPGLNGYQVVSELRKRIPTWFPIIFISTSTSNEDVVKGMRAGGDDYLFKPVNYEILHSKVDSLLSRLRMSNVIVSQNRQLRNFKDRVSEEREMATQLIATFTELDKIDDPLVRYHLRAAEHFSGDMVAVARTPDDRVHVMLADSAGHGLTAALSVIPLTQPFYQMTAKGFELESIVREINRRVREYLKLPRYVSAILVSLDVGSKRIQVWNGGCPPALLVDRSDSKSVRRFASNHLPLGVLSDEEFDATIEHYVYGDVASRLFLCSDGVSELRDEKGERYGLARLLDDAAAPATVCDFDSLLHKINHVLGAREPEDDLALMQIDCPVLVEAAAEEALLSQQPPMVTDERVAGCACDDAGKEGWQFAVTLHAHQLRRLDVIPFLLGITGQIDNVQSGNRLFLVLSELFNNALDHGLLNLDSNLKSSVDGIDRYLEERSTRLANLEHGEIEFKLTRLEGTTCTVCEDGKRMRSLKIHIRDSGKGFDHASRVVPALHENMQHHGRGIPLLLKLCSEVEYLGNGSEVIAYLNLTHG